jgi:5-methylcytosine-specific restriction endonuclease McrA
MDPQSLPKSRIEAKAVGAAYYFTGIPCIRGHIEPRSVKGDCTGCSSIHREMDRIRQNEAYQKRGQSEAAKAAKRRYYERNREAVIARAAARPVEERRRADRVWKEKHPLLVRANNTNRKRKHRQATPIWLTYKQKSEMRELYKIAITMTKTTGERYAVDHIIPLRSDVVCGLHVPWNLRVITQEENLKKSNKVVDALFQ